MAARNGTGHFGWVSRGIHWLMALALILNLGFGAWLARIEPSFSTLWMYGAHKSAGMTLLALVLIRLAWHRVSPPPKPLTIGIAPWQYYAARLGHWGLYALMLAVPLSGWFASSATGIPTVIFGRWTLPAIAPASERLDQLGFWAHDALTKALLALILIHVGAALYHALILRDPTLRRMWRGR